MKITLLIKLLISFTLSLLTIADDFNIQYLEGTSLINYFDSQNKYTKTTCVESPSYYLRPFFSSFICKKGLTEEPGIDLPVFRFTSLPPHYERDVKVEALYLTNTNVSISWKFDANQFTTSFGGNNTRFEFDCSKQDDDVDHLNLINLNYGMTGIANNAVSTIRAMESCSTSISDLVIGSIQLNVNLCHPSCLECSGPLNTQCTKCDTTCSTLTNSSCILKANDLRYFQFGSCVTSCNALQSFFPNQKNCFKRSFCETISNNICTKCLSGKYLIPSYDDAMSQCVDECPVGFTQDNTLKLCSDNNINILKLYGNYILRGLYTSIFSGIEIKNMGITMIKNHAQTATNISKISKCGLYQLYGGHLVNLKTSQINFNEINSNFNFVKVRFKYVFIDYPTDNATGNTDVTVSIGGTETFNIDITSPLSKKNMCGVDLTAASKSSTEVVGEFSKDFIIPSTKKIKLVILNNNSLSIPYLSNINKVNIHPFFGIREISLYAYNCKKTNCIACSSDTVCTQCELGYVLIGSSCQQCNAMCETCINSINQCVLCKYTKIWNSSSQTCVCQSGTYWNSSTCISCPTSNCSTCSQTSPYDCSACSSGFFLLGTTCVTSCGSGYFQNTTTYKCEQCVANCKQCPSVSQCSQCSGNYFVTTAGLCVASCPVNQFTDTVYKKCILCTDANCNSCTQSQNTCQTCKSTFFLQGTVCQTTCDSGYYPDSTTSQCKDCATKFSNCQICTFTSCTKCKNSFYLLNNKCETCCPFGYYATVNGGISVCFACQNPKCGTCAINSNICYTCDQSAYPYKQGDLCVDTCSSGYYLDGFICKQCLTKYTGCQTCNSTKCLTCTTSTYYLDQVNNSCGSTCPSNTFKQVISGQNVCTLCDLSCLTCGTSSINCLTCLQSSVYKYLQGDKCQLSCDPKYYSDDTNTCRLCSNKFQLCGECTSTACTGCNDPTYYLIIAENKCVQNCPEGYVVDSSLSKLTCLKCSANCKTCETPDINKCLSCYTNSNSLLPYLDTVGNTCQSSCSSEQFADSLKVCQPCRVHNADCEECNQNRCTKCKTQLLDSSNWQCVDSCTNPDYGNIYNGMCVQYCNDLNCVICDQSDKDICSECISSVFLQGDKCQPNCNYGYYTQPFQNVCKQCTDTYPDCQECNATICTHCNDPLKLYDPLTNQCQTDCSLGYYKDASDFTLGCQKCLNDKCETCDPSPNSSKCLSCYQTSLNPLQEGDQCVSTCSAKYYQVALECIACPVGCSSCNASGCIQCTASYYLNTLNNTCNLTCPDNYYQAQIGDDNICMQCPNQECQSCDIHDTTLCTMCYTNGLKSLLEENKCQDNCSSGFYPDDMNKTCQKCSDTYDNCSTCNSTQCLSCIDNFYFNKNTNTCDQSCGQTYYESNTLECLDCPSHCLSCDSTNCFNCDDLSFLQYSFLLSANVCSITCDPSFYPDLSVRQCTLCTNIFPNCQECSAEVCTVCNDVSYYLKVETNECIINCNFDNHYEDTLANGQKACLRCQNSNCKTCNKAGDCLSCYDNSSKPYLDQDKFCVDECPIVFDSLIGKCTSSCSYPQIQDNLTKVCVNCSDFIYNNKCYQNCAVGTVANPDSSKTCVMCSSVHSTSCIECISLACTKCQNTYLQDDGSCKVDCPPGQFINVTEGKCVDTCDTDQQMYADYNSMTCEKCNLALCHKCLDANDKCISCEVGKFLELSESKCYDVCADGKFGNVVSQNCEQCSQDCLLCSTSALCTKCNSNILYQGACISTCPQDTFLHQKECITSCPSYYFANLVKRECQKCSDNCSDCISLSQCNTCDSGYALNNHNICIKCSSNCIHCLYDKLDLKCIQCNEEEGYYLLNAKCLYCYGKADQIFDSLTNGCITKSGSGPTPYLKIQDVAVKIDNRIIIKGTIYFDTIVKIVESKVWNLKIDIENELNYNIHIYYPNLPSQLSNNLSNQYSNTVLPITILIDEEEQDNYNTLFIDFLDPYSVINENGLRLVKTQLSAPLPKIGKEKSSPESTISKTVQGILTVSQIALLVTTPLYMVVSFFDLIQMMNYLLYLNVSYPELLHSIIQVFDFANFEIIPNLKNEKAHSPHKFKIENVDTFVYSNLIQSIVIWSTSLALYVLSKVLQNSRWGYSKNVFMNLVRVYKQNYIYKIIIGLGFLTYCDLLLAVFLQFYDSTSISVIEVIGILSAIVLLLVIVGLNYLSFAATQINVYDLQLKEHIKRVYGYLYNGYSMNNSKPMMNFIFLLRKSVVMYQLVFNQTNPISQVFVCCLMFGFETTFMIIARPYKQRKELIINLTCRFILIFAIIFILILSIDDFVGLLSSTQRNSIGILTSILLITIYIFYFIYILKQVYTNYKRNKFSPQANSLQLVK